MTTYQETRKETDSLGTVDVPEDAYYGAFTVRARENFSITGQGAHPAFITALGQIKQAAAMSNYELDQLDEETKDAIVQASEEVAAGEYNDQFVLDTIQAGAGTPFHMNANEVIANRATEILGGAKGEYLVHPNDDVNMGQSSNNVIPTATRLAAITLTNELLDELDKLAAAFEEKADAFDDLVKVGRTHLQDAVPVTLGQEMQAYATMCRNSSARIQNALDELHVIGLGGNAVGTGINTDPSFREDVVEHLADVTGHNLEPADDPRAMTQSMAPFTHLSSALRTFGTDAIKLADDLILLSSGPKAGMHELELPEVEPGSSIMPGKVNPSIVEAFKMTCLQVKGNDETIATAAQEGDLELNVMTPVIAHNLFQSIESLTNATRMLREKCVDGIDADEDRIAELFDGSTATATALSPYLGYDKTAEVVKQALDEDTSIRDVVVDEGLMDEADVDQVLQQENLTQPNGVDQDLMETYRDDT